MTETSNFRVETDNHIAWLILNRPEKRNVMGRAFFEEIGSWFDDFDRNPDIRVVIIKAEGKSFSAGTDLEDLNLNLLFGFQIYLNKNNK